MCRVRIVLEDEEDEPKRKRKELEGKGDKTVKTFLKKGSQQGVFLPSD